METNVPVMQLPISRGLLKIILLGFITLGIYPLVVYSKISREINIIASRHDGLSTMHYILVLLLSPFTFGIVPLVWFHRICNRIGNELRRRGIPYEFDASTFWLWNVLGYLILVGPLVFVHKFMKAMNILNADYNEKG